MPVNLTNKENQLTDIYAEFGVNSAVISSSDPAEHEQNMLALNVRARDGDTSIELTQPEEETTEETVEETAEEGTQDAANDTQEEAPEASLDGVEPLGEPSEDLEKASSAIERYAEGFATMRGQAIQNGLTPAMADAIEAEYEADGKLSEGSFQALEKAGFTRNFIESYIQGQEAVAEQFVTKVVEYAGGQEKFQRIISHMETSSPDAVEALMDAIERRDLKAVRSMINLGIQSRSAKLGKAPERTATKKAAATPQVRQAPKAEGYTSTAEMVKDMSSAAYRNDPAFRAKVEQRVAASKF